MKQIINLLRVAKLLGYNVTQVMTEIRWVRMNQLIVANQIDILRIFWRIFVDELVCINNLISPSITREIFFCFVLAYQEAKRWKHSEELKEKGKYLF